jgi:phosphatidate cytidylyltransferase
MNDLKVRTITGAVFGVCCVGSIMASFYSFILFFFFVHLVCLYEYLQITLSPNKHSASKYVTIVLGCLVFLSPYLVQNSDHNIGLLSIVACLFILLFHMVKEGKPNVHQSLHMIGGVVLISLPLSCVFYISKFNLDYNWQKVMFLIALVWVSDMAQYFTGRKLGKHPLAIELSPKKTWEGWLGGLVITTSLSVIFTFYIPIYPISQTIIIALLVVVFGTLGDLTQSALKRHYQVKDSGTILPGHGGLYDRFDAVIFVFPIVAFFIDWFH